MSPIFAINLSLLHQLRVRQTKFMRYLKVHYIGALFFVSTI
jgi:hypothetical protein